MDAVKQRTMELLKVLRDNGFNIIRTIWEDCGSGEHYEEYKVIDTKTNIALTGTGYVYKNSFKELRPEVKTID